MALYEYRAIDKKGKNRKGKIDAISAKQANIKIKSFGLHPVSITSSKSKLDAETASRKAGGISTPKVRKSRVPYKVVTDFTRQLSVLVGTGIPYDKAFEILITECEHPSFQHVLSAVKGRVVEGSSLATALEEHPQLFSKMYVAMVKAGEAGGTLDKVLGYLTASREINEEITAKIQKSMIYPAIMTVIGLGIVVFMMTFIIPRIIPIFSQFDIALPLPTRIVIAVSNSIVQHWWLYLLTTAILLLLFNRIKTTQRGEKIFDRIQLQIPVIKTILKKTIIFRFTQTLCTLLKSGVELKSALEIARQALGNRSFDDQFKQVSTEITQKGKDLSQALQPLRLFPVSVIQMIRVGEESSRLEDMLERVSEIQEAELKQSLEKTIALIEPLLILWMALLVGFLILAVMLPMIKMNQLI